MDFDEFKKKIQDGKDNPELLDVYEEIREDVKAEILYDDLSIFRMILLLQSIKNDAALRFLLVVLAHPMKSFSDIAEECGISKQAAHKKLKKLAEKHEEVSLLMDLREKYIGRQGGTGSSGRGGASEVFRSGSKGR